MIHRARAPVGKRLEAVTNYDKLEDSDSSGDNMEEVSLKKGISCAQRIRCSFAMQSQKLLHSPTRKRQRPTTILAGTVVIGAISIVLILLQLHAYVTEYQGPFDHITTSFLVPYYSLFCPDVSAVDGLGIDSTNENDNMISWGCNDVQISGVDANAKNHSTKFPRIFMIGARDAENDTFDDWTQKLQLSNHSLNSNDGSVQYQNFAPYLERINTLKMSNQYALSGGAQQSASNNANPTSSESDQSNRKRFLCRKMKWEHRLFAVYQSVFANLLAKYPNDAGFVIIEDDAVLQNPLALFEEVCNARNLQLEFYSLYRSPLQLKGMKSPSCIYQHGTVAFYIQRSIMEKIVNERRREHFCRFPIDMYISKMGPWYATKRDIVGHVGSGRVGST